MKNMNFALPIVIAFFMFMAMPIQPSFAEDAMPLAKTKKILVVYFSHTGNTREIANQIHKQVGGDIFEIQSIEPYPTDYDACVKQAREELDSDYKPALKTKVKNIASYDVVFIGYPNWWGTFPAPVKTFLSENDLSGKTIVPFCTHGGGGLGRSVTDIAELCPKSTLLESFAIPGTQVKTAQDKVSAWLRRIKVTE